MAASGPMGILRETFDKFSQMKKPVWKEFGMDAPPVYRPGEMAGYAVGRVAADVTSDATRERVWRLNALQAQTTDLGRSIGTKMGLSKRDAILAGYGLTQVVELASGNVDIRNLDEAGRPAGYRSIFPVESMGIDHVTGEQIVIKDFLKSQNPVAEVAARYLLGRTGSVLPWEQFKIERPDVTPEDYARVMRQYRDKTLFGIEKRDPKVTTAIGTLAGAGVAALTKKPMPLIAGAAGGFLAPSAANVVSELGVLQGTRESFDDPVGEVRVFGYRLPIAKVAGAATLAIGLGVGGKKLYDADILNLNKIKEFGQDRFTKKWNKTDPQGNLWGPEDEDGFPIRGQK